MPDGERFAGPRPGPRPGWPATQLPAPAVFSSCPIPAGGPIAAWQPEARLVAARGGVPAFRSGNTSASSQQRGLAKGPARPGAARFRSAPRPPRPHTPRTGKVAHWPLGGRGGWPGQKSARGGPRLAPPAPPATPRRPPDRGRRAAGRQKKLSSALLAEKESVPPPSLSVRARPCANAAPRVLGPHRYDRRRRPPPRQFRVALWPLAPGPWPAVAGGTRCSSEWRCPPALARHPRPVLR